MDVKAIRYMNVTTPFRLLECQINGSPEIVEDGCDIYRNTSNQTSTKNQYSYIYVYRINNYAKDMDISIWNIVAVWYYIQNAFLY